MTKKEDKALAAAEAKAEAARVKREAESYPTNETEAARVKREEAEAARARSGYGGTKSPGTVARDERLAASEAVRNETYPASGDGWVNYQDRLPTEEDASEDGKVWVAHGDDAPVLENYGRVKPRGRSPNHYWTAFANYEAREPEPGEPKEPQEPPQPEYIPGV